MSTKSKLYFCIVDNGMGLSRTRWAFSMIHAALTTLRGYAVALDHISFPSPDGAMNMAVNHFRDSDADEFICIDTDIVFDPIDLKELLEHDLPIVFGLYPQKQAGLVWPVTPLDNAEGKGRLREVARCGRGFMRVRREVFDKIAPHCITFEDSQTGRSVPIFFDALPGGHSEDFFFCDLVRNHDYKIMVDTGIVVKHEGTALYPIEGTYAKNLLIPKESAA